MAPEALLYSFQKPWPENSLKIADARPLQKKKKTPQKLYSITFLLREI